MIIALDGYEANEPRRVGISRYAFEVFRHMYDIRSSQIDATSTFRIYLPTNRTSDWPPETSWWQYKIGGPKKFWTLCKLPFSLAFDAPRADIVFSPTHYIPRFISLPRVMSIMDVSYLKFPELFRASDYVKLTRWTAYAVAHARKIFTISEFSKNAIINEYKVPSERVIVTYPGLSIDRVNSMKNDTVQDIYNVGPHYILSVGTIQPRKNYVRLIEAFSIFLKENKQKFHTISLVIVGKKGWLYEDILEAPKRYGVDGMVKFLEFVPDAHLPLLYEHALCFALPSLYEGFGLPVLEAMTYKCPVVVSNVSSLPEIAGKAGVYVDPEDVRSIADGLLTAVRQRNLMQGKYRIQHGVSQAKKFTWEAAAKKTLSVLEEIGGKKL